MKRMLGESRKTMRQYWRRLMESHQNGMPQGARHINKIISWARGENWRGKRENKKT